MGKPALKLDNSRIHFLIAAKLEETKREKVKDMRVAFVSISQSAQG
jgi:hypothetical protein